jgi:hypothetical protein
MSESTTQASGKANSDGEDSDLLLVQEVRTAYADAGEQRDNEHFVDDERCLSFLTSGWFEDGELLKEALDAIGGYNRFDPDRVATRTKELNEEHGDIRVAVGREGSPVLYIECENPGDVKDAFEDYADECWEVEHDQVGNARKWADDDGYDAHTMCRHDEPPVEAEDFADPGRGRPVVRCWWD